MSMKNKVITAEQAIALIKDGDVVDVGVADGEIKLKPRKSKAKAA